jgi:uncharacterized protein YkwD
MASQQLSSRSWLPLLLVFVSLLPLVRCQNVVTITASTPRPSDSPELTDRPTFTSAILNSTNHYRQEHNATAVVWNRTLEDFATRYLDSTCDFEHSGGPYGENLALGCSNATSCVEMWGNERDQYDFRKAEFTMETGHFTQLVWKNTTDVGCGVKNCEGRGGHYIVCEYWPRGNVIGAFSTSVTAKTGAAAGLAPSVLAALLLATLCALVVLM